MSKDKKLYNLVVICIIGFCIILFLGLFLLSNQAKKSYKKYSNNLSPEERVKLAGKKKLLSYNKDLANSQLQRGSSSSVESSNSNKEVSVSKVETSALLSKEEFTSLTTICRTCHAEDKRIIGPSYIEIAKYYTKKINTSLLDNLSEKVLLGSMGMQAKGYKGPWVEKGYAPVMTANPIDKQKAKAIISYILKQYK